MGHRFQFNKLMDYFLDESVSRWFFEVVSKKVSRTVNSVIARILKSSLISLVFLLGYFCIDLLQNNLTGKHT